MSAGSMPREHYVRLTKFIRGAKVIVSNAFDAHKQRQYQFMIDELCRKGYFVAVMQQLNTKHVSNLCVAREARADDPADLLDDMGEYAVAEFWSGSYHRVVADM